MLEKICAELECDIGDIIEFTDLESVIEIEYHRRKGSATVKRKIKSVAIMFSEYYFYLTAFIDDEDTRQNFDVINYSFPTIYRIDCWKSYKVLDDKFHIPYTSRFEEGSLENESNLCMVENLIGLNLNILVIA